MGTGRSFFERARMRLFVKFWLCFFALIAGSDDHALAQIDPLPVIDQQLRSSFPDVETMNAEALQRRLAQKDPPIILDVREADEFAVSHLKGAVHVDPKAELADVLRAIGPTLGGRDVIVYCSVGVRSTQLAERLRDELKARGIRSVANLAQGIFGWHNAGRPLAQGPHPTPFVHPYNALWGQLVTRQTLTAYTPITAELGPVKAAAFNETLIRLSSFLGVFVVLALAEGLRPRRVRMQPKGQRWLTHFGMLALATLLVRAVIFLLPLVGATAAALYAGQHDWGLFNRTDLPTWLEILLAVALLDLAIWAQHVATHHVPLLWRLHKVHHADRDLDASSALRFHPVEILVSALYKLVMILVLGPAVVAVIAFEILLNASAMFNHANLALPPRVDAALRLIIVTPDMHRIHHSIIRTEHDRNFGFCLSIWDRIFGTYISAPRGGQERMTVGLADWQSDDRPSRLGWLLWLPFQKS
jgi:sterol desaturase/sphingolipid hydroxylase (fatty acid hydroxylase superfamily)/rhodanese-related sulfurtransferase